MIARFAVVSILLAQVPRYERPFVVIDPILAEPCTLIRSVESIALPESLGGIKWSGFGVVEIVLNEDCDVIDIKVLRLKLTDILCGEDYIDFTIASSSTIDTMLCKYVALLESHIRNKLVLRKMSQYRGRSKAILKIEINGK